MVMIVFFVMTNLLLSLSLTYFQVLATSKGGILQCNDMVSEVFGFSLDELKGGNVTMLMPPETAANHHSYMDK